MDSDIPGVGVRVSRTKLGYTKDEGEPLTVSATRNGIIRASHMLTKTVVLGQQPTGSTAVPRDVPYAW